MRPRFTIATLTIVVFAAAGFMSTVRADDDNSEETYRKAVELHQKAEAKRKQAGELETQAGKTDDADAKERLQRDAKALRQSADEPHSQARFLMGSIAPRDRKGYGPAHVWMFDDLYRMTEGPDGKPQPPSPLVLLDCERHLLHALEWSDDNVKIKAHFGLARLYRDTNRIDDAKKHLTAVAEKHPEYWLILAKWAKTQNENELMITHAKAAEQAFRTRLTASADDHEARFGLAECLTLQSRFSETRELFNIGATLATKPELVRAYARRMAELLVNWTDAKENDPKSTIGERLQLLEEALRLDPDNPEIFNRLIKLSRDKSPEAEKAREQLHQMLTDGKDSFLLRLFLGIDAFQQGKTEEARHHWEKSFAQSNGAPIVANNLAWLLAFSEPVDLPRALELANSAVKAVPDEARFRGTRGHILHKMGRYKEALEDLEKAIKAYPKDPKLFRALSETCSKLNMPIQAENYKKRADELEAEEKAKPAKPKP
jgi:tetratricopeptide (TPR) repeat protein